MAGDRSCCKLAFVQHIEAQCLQVDDAACSGLVAVERSCCKLLSQHIEAQWLQSVDAAYLALLLMQYIEPR